MMREDSNGKKEGKRKGRGAQKDRAKCMQYVTI